MASSKTAQPTDSTVEILGRVHVQRRSQPNLFFETLSCTPVIEIPL
jgi:hypothetical protein